MGIQTKTLLLGWFAGCTIEGFRHWEQFRGLPWLVGLATAALVVYLLPGIRRGPPQ